MIKANKFRTWPWTIFQITKLLGVLVLITFLFGVFPPSLAHADVVSDYLNSVKSYPKKEIGTEASAQYIGYSSLDGIISKNQADGFQIQAKSLEKAGEYCPGSGGDDCGNFVQLEKSCSSGQSIVKQYKVVCDSKPQDATAAVPCYVPTAKALAVYPGQENQTCNGSSNPTPTPQNACTVPPDVEQKRQEIFNEIKQKYKFKVSDGNMCGEDPTCGENPPWSLDDLTTIKDTLDQLPACFVNNLNLNEISGRRHGEILDKLGDGISNNECCSQNSIQKCVYGGFIPYGYDKIVFCGNRASHPLSSCKLTYDLKGIIVHELTHAFQYNGTNILPMSVYNNPIVMKWLQQTGWSTDSLSCNPLFGCFGQDLGPPQFPQVPPDLPSPYAKSSRDPLEDMAESVRLYFEAPAELKLASLRRYNFVRDNIMCGNEFSWSPK